MPPHPSEALPPLSLKAQWLLAVLGLISLLFFMDGLWGFGRRYGVVVLLLAAGLSGLLVAAWRGRLMIFSVMGLTLTTALAGCLVMECVIRLCLADPTIPIDERGFERRIQSTWPHPIEPQPKEGVFRILGLSDSFGLAGGGKNYHGLLAGLLAGHGVTAEVINFSLPGAHPQDQLGLLQRFGARYQPALILHGIFVGNDFIFPEAQIVEVAGVPVPYVSGPRGYRPHFLLLFQWITGEFKVLREAYQLGREQRAGDPSATNSGAAFLWTESKYLLTFQKDAHREMEWSRTLEAIHQVQAEARKMGARYVMVIHPDQCQINADLRTRVQQEYHLNPEDFDLDLPQRYLKEDCEQQGIPCLDLLPVFREQGDKGELYHFRDSHWNDAGNRLAAESIAMFLHSQSLIPGQTVQP